MSLGPASVGSRWNEPEDSEPDGTFISICGFRAAMKVKDLRPESKVDTISLTITSKGDVREFTSRSGSVGKVCDCKAKDEDGEEVQITLWNEEIERVRPNDRVTISNGWVREWRGNLQVSAGRYGRLEVLK